MNDVSEVLADYFDLRAKHGHQLRIEPPTDSATREIQLSKIFGAHVPQDVSAAYEFCDGFGLEDRMEDDGVNWILPPVERLGEIAASSKWFADTHPDLANQFHPILFCDGDCLGYMKGAGEIFESGLYNFGHEDYLHEGGQEWIEFMTPFELGLVDYLRYEMTYY